MGIPIIWLTQAVFLGVIISNLEGTLIECPKLENLIEIDVPAKAMEIGDTNVVMLGALSQITPFNRIEKELWLQAPKEVIPSALLWGGNYKVFNEGRELIWLSQRLFENYLFYPI